MPGATPQPKGDENRLLTLKHYLLKVLVRQLHTNLSASMLSSLLSQRVCLYTPSMPLYPHTLLNLCLHRGVEQKSALFIHFYDYGGIEQRVCFYTSIQRMLRR